MEVGGKTWIGTVECSLVLEWHLGFQSKILFLNDAASLSLYSVKLLTHFNEHGSPIMMGVGNFAYTLVGVATETDGDETAYCVVDPHYTGSDTLKTILDKAWVGWKKLDFFVKVANGSFINLALPQVTDCV
eukprot:Platyproteum_vivax@DN599_c0_g1_i1.p1